MLGRLIFPSFVGEPPGEGDRGGDEGRLNAVATALGCGEELKSSADTGRTAMCNRVILDDVDSVVNAGCDADFAFVGLVRGDLMLLLKEL